MKIEFGGKRSYFPGIKDFVSNFDLNGDWFSIETGTGPFGTYVFETAINAYCTETEYSRIALIEEILKSDLPILKEKRDSLKKFLDELKDDEEGEE